MKLKSTLLKYMIISLIALVCFSFFNNCEQNDSSVTWQINDLEYFEATGLNVLVFHNSYAVGKQAGIEIIQHGERVATNGYISLELLDGGEGELPAQAEAHRIVDQNNGSIKTRIAYPEFEFNYLINIEAEGEALRLSVDLDQPLREEWRNSAIFKLEFYPSAYFGKTFQLGETSDIFPRQLNGPTVIDAEGKIRPTPLATGNKLIIAAEDPLLKMEIEQVEGELELIDGRYLNRHGWFFLQSRIPVGKTAGALEWIINLNSVAGWERDPMIACSQVGYHPEQIKHAIIELDPNTNAAGKASLHRIKRKGGTEEVLSSIPDRWGKFLRYEYAIFDFSSITVPGLYMIRYDDQKSEPFQIAVDVYKRNVWQPTLESFLPIQMCHMRIKDRWRVWHDACHLDDALQAPLSIEHSDGYSSYAKTETQYKPMTSIPGLNQGGWHDAGDNDLAAGSQAGTLYYLALASESFNVKTDQTAVDQENRLVVLHRPDGIPDIVQQVKHGVENLLTGYRIAGHCFPGIVETREGRAFLGDVASLTDQKFYDTSFKPDQVEGNYSGVSDDRWVFTNKHTPLEYKATYALAAASRVLRGYEDDLADECLATAEKVWTFEQNHSPVAQPNAYTPRDIEVQEILATAELLVTTDGNQYRERLIDLMPVIIEHIGSTGWLVVQALDSVNDDSFRSAIIDGLRKYKEELDVLLAETPFGVPWQPKIWGVGWNIQRYAVEQFYLNQAFPDIFNREHLFSVVNYVLGCHPASNTSFVSGVGAHSILEAYGFNMHEWSYIPGGVISGTALVRPDLPELKEPFPYLWQQSEYVIGGAATYIFCVLAADKLLNG